MPTSTLMPTPVPTLMPTLMPTSTTMPAPESSRMSLDEYAAFCAELEAGETTEEEGEITYGEFSAGLQLYIVAVGVGESSTGSERLAQYVVDESTGTEGSNR